MLRIGICIKLTTLDFHSIFTMAFRKFPIFYICPLEIHVFSQTLTDLTGIPMTFTFTPGIFHGYPQEEVTNSGKSP